MKKFDLRNVLSPEFLFIFSKVAKCDPILRQALNIKEKALVNTFLIDGAKGAAKTWGILIMSILISKINPRQSWILAMESKSENYQKTQQTFKRILLEIFEPFFPGFYSKFDFYTSESRLSIRYWNGQHEQVWNFVSIDEMGEGGHTAPVPTYYGIIMDDIILRKSANETSYDNHLNAMTSLRNLQLSLTRLLPEEAELITFISMNCFAGNSPWLEKESKFLVEDLKKQVIELFTWAENLNDGEFYARISLEANPFVKRQDLENVNKQIISWSEFLSEKYGMKSYGRDSSLNYLMHLINEKQSWTSSINKNEFVITSVGIDVGGFGHESAKTVMSLIGWHPTKQFFTVIDELVYDPKTQTKIDPSTLAYQFILKLAQWEKDYYTFAFPKWTLKIDIIIDPTDGGNSYFMELMKQQYIHFLKTIPIGNIVGLPLQKINFVLASFKWAKNWDGITRSYQWETMIGSGLFVPFRNYSPWLFKELPAMRIINGKRNDNDIDCIQSVEYGMYKWMMQFFNNTRLVTDESRKRISMILNNK